MHELQADLIMCCQPHTARSHREEGSDNCDLLLLPMLRQGAISVLYD